MLDNAAYKTIEALSAAQARRLETPVSESNK